MEPNEPIGTSAWNDQMYSRHRTPYGNNLAGFIQEKRIARVLAYARIERADRVLEIGCEGGKLCSAVPPCERLVGSDISARALRDAESLFQKHSTKAEFILHDALRPLPFQAGEFDVIICSEMLEHVTDPEAVILNIAGICHAKTRVVFTVPIEAPKLVLKRWLEKIGLFRMLLPGIERGQSEWHLQSFSKPMLQDLTEKSFKCDRLSTVWGCHVVGLFHRRLIGMEADAHQLQ